MGPPVESAWTGDDETTACEPRDATRGNLAAPTGQANGPVAAATDADVAASGDANCERTTPEPTPMVGVDAAAADDDDDDDDDKRNAADATATKVACDEPPVGGPRAATSRVDVAIRHGTVASTHEQQADPMQEDKVAAVGVLPRVDELSGADREARSAHDKDGGELPSSSSSSSSLEGPAPAAPAPPNIDAPGDLCAASSTSLKRRPQHQDESDSTDEEADDGATFGAPWTKDVRRWCLATLTPHADGEQAKIHIAMLRREFLLAAREKPYFKDLSGPLSRPRSRDSRAFLAALLAVVGGHAKQSQCVINGVNQIGIIGFSYKRPTPEDYARSANVREILKNSPAASPAAAQQADSGQLWLRLSNQSAAEDAPAAPAIPPLGLATSDGLPSAFHPAKKGVGRKRQRKPSADGALATATPVDNVGSQGMPGPVAPQLSTSTHLGSTSLYTQPHPAVPLSGGTTFSLQNVAASPSSAEARADDRVAAATSLTAAATVGRDASQVATMQDVIASAAPASTTTPTIAAEVCGPGGLAAESQKPIDAETQSPSSFEFSDETTCSFGAVFTDGQPKAQFAVRMFKYGACQQLAVYNLTSLRNSPEPSEDVLPGSQDLTRILEGYRPRGYLVGGFDAVALGLLSLGSHSYPVPYALRTLTIVDKDTVRISNAATDTRLPEYLDFENILDIFDSQLLHLALKLLPNARYLAVEAQRASKNFAKYAERGLPVIDNGSGALRGKLYFREWAPTSLYTNLFPYANGNVVHLRAELSPVILVASPAPENQEPATTSLSSYARDASLAAAAAAAVQQHRGSMPNAAAASTSPMISPIVAMPTVTNGIPQQTLKPAACSDHLSRVVSRAADASDAETSKVVYDPYGAQFTIGDDSIRDRREAASFRLMRSPLPEKPTHQQLAQWSSQIGVVLQPTDATTLAAINQGSRCATNPVAGASTQHQQHPQYHMAAQLAASPAPFSGGLSAALADNDQSSGASTMIYSTIPMASPGGTSQMATQAQFYPNQPSIDLQTVASPTNRTRRSLSPAERKARDLKAAQRQLRQIQNHKNGVLSKKRPEAPPSWVVDVTNWASRVLKPESEARLHVSKLRDEFLRSRSNEAFLRHLQQQQSPPSSESTSSKNQLEQCSAAVDAVDYDELRRLFALPKSHESRLFTLTILSVVGVDSKRQQCVIGGINQCGIIGWKIDYSEYNNHDASLPSDQASTSPPPPPPPPVIDAPEVPGPVVEQHEHPEPAMLPSPQAAEV